MTRIATVLATAFLLAGTADAQTKEWTTTPDFNLGTLTNATDTKIANEVVLGPTQVSQKHVVWSNNTDYGLVVRLDSITGKQTARYDSTLTTVTGVSTGARPANEVCNSSSTGNCPQFAAVDTTGDLWVVNSAYGNQGTLTRIAGDLSRCVDRNNNGVIDTSSDLNGDGLIDMNLADHEYLGQSDECILSTTAVGTNNAVPVGVAVDRYGKIWVATSSTGNLYRFNPNPPLTLEITVAVGNPFSVATGGDYVFVNSASGSGIARVQALTGAIDYAPCPTVSEGLVADPGGAVAYAGSWSMATAGLYRADFSVTPHTCTLMTGGSSTIGLTMDTEPAPGPYVWATDYSIGNVSKFTTAGTFIKTYTAGTNPRGIAIDFQDNVWIVDGSSPNYNFLLDINPTTGVTNASCSLGFLPADASKYGADAKPLFDGDFTGVQIDRQAPYAVAGSWSGVFDGGRAGIPWARLTWNTEAQGAVPVLTSLQVTVSAADSLAALASAPAVAATNGAALAGVNGEFVQVTVSLAGPGFATAVLSDITIAGPCAVLGTACCIQDSNCNDGNACTTDTCPTVGGTCQFSATAQCCVANQDCNDGNPCTLDSCPSAGGQCTNAAIAGCCLSDMDCNDGDACSVDICSAPGGTCTHPLVRDCCLTNLDCTLGNKCSAATCPTPGGFCTGGSIPGCCAVDTDCINSDPCSTPSCDAATGLCANTTIPDCCSTDAQCATTQPCTNATCSGTGGVCVVTEVASCCITDADCGESDACTTNKCSGAGGVCGQSREPNCCVVAGDCDDGDACTNDLCPTPGGACTHDAIPSCCSTSADCDDGDRCTQDECATPGGACTHSPLTNCCATDSDCDPTSTCVDGWCQAVLDAGPVNPGPADRGPVDAGIANTGTVNTGTVDTGAVDAGSVDAGNPGSHSSGGCASGDVGALAMMALLAVCLRRGFAVHRLSARSTLTGSASSAR